jgi:hypothetical protein
MTIFFAHESGRETGKSESLADDNTTLMLQTSENFLNLRNILDKFASVSGLHCNFDKTCVLLVGPVDPLVNLHGFIPTEKIKLLGFDVTKTLKTRIKLLRKFMKKLRD